MLEELKERVYKQNMRLVTSGLVILTWGNVSAFDEKSGFVVIKPSGVDYSVMRPEDMVVVDLDGKIIEGNLRPSSDTPTHLYLYRNFKGICGIVHTHSTYATAWAQSGRAVPPYGTTHADAFYGEIPCTRDLTKEEIEKDYELNTGKVIFETFKNADHNAVPAVLVKNHGPFTWGASPEKAVDTAITLEEVAKMAHITEAINPKAAAAPQYLSDKHYYRKHGKNAYYGQQK